MYLHTYSNKFISETEEEAARAYDVAVIRMKGVKAVTNFDLNHYDIRSILESQKLPIGKGASKLLKMTAVDDVLHFKRNNHDKQKVPPALQLRLDTKIDQIVPKPIKPQEQSMLESPTSPTRTETGSNNDIIAHNVLDSQNPSSSLFHVHQDYYQPEVQNSDLNSSYGMIGSNAPALGFQMGRVSELHHSESLESIITDSGTSNGMLEGEDQYRYLSESSQALEDLEDFDQFFENQFGLQPNPSFQSVHASQNPNDHFQNPSFLHLLANDGSVTDGDLGYPSASYWRIDDHGNPKIATEAGNSSNMVNIFGKEIQEMETSDYRDFLEFPLDHKSDKDFQNFLQNPSYSFFPH